MTGSVENAIALAARLEAFDAKLDGVFENKGMALTAGGQATAIAMLVALNLPIFAEAAAELRGLARQGTSS